MVICHPFATAILKMALCVQRGLNFYDDVEQRNYFSFYRYEYALDVTKQYEWMGDVKPLKTGLREALDWHRDNPGQAVKKPFLEYIDRYFPGYDGKNVPRRVMRRGTAALLKGNHQLCWWKERA